MLTDVYKAEYTKGLSFKKINELKYAVTTYESLYEGIAGFKGDMQNQFNYTMEFCDGLKEEIIDPLQKLWDKYRTKSNNINTEYKNADKIYRISVNKMEDAKVKFHSSAREAEEYKYLCEINKQNQAMSQEAKIKNEIKTQEALRQAKENENNYIVSINQANIILENYIEIKTRCFNDIQECEEEMSESIKDGLRKYVIFQVSYNRNVQYDIEKKAKLMEDINVKRDIRAFINKKATNVLPPYKFDFIPYISDIKSFPPRENETIPNETYSNVKSFISNVFFSEPSFDLSKSETKSWNEIESIVNSIHQGKSIPSEIHETVSQILRNKRNRRWLFSNWNQVRLKSNFILSDVSYKTLGDIWIEALNVLQWENDFQSVKHWMNWSMCLYKPASGPNWPRVFLQSYLSQHTIWRNVVFWKEVIKHAIIEEMQNQKSYNWYNDESFDEKNERFKSIAKAQLNSYLYNMISFDVQIGLIKETVQFFVDYYEIENEFYEGLLKIIDEYKKRQEAEEEKKRKIEQERKEEEEEKNMKWEQERKETEEKLKNENKAKETETKTETETSIKAQQEDTSENVISKDDTIESIEITGIKAENTSETIEKK